MTTGEPQINPDCPNANDPSSQAAHSAPVSFSSWTIFHSSLALSILLIAATIAAYWPLNACDFINYDDHDYVTENPHVLKGFTLPGVVWAFSTTHAGNWHPLTWLSHMLDVQWFALRSGAHHLTGLVFHIGNSLLLFFLFKKMTGAIWRSAMVAALFALHPLHVESVAWISERKDVLSTFFGLLSIWAYTGYVRFKVQSSKFKVPSQKLDLGISSLSSSITHHPSSVLYVLSVLLFACALMSKPML